MHTSRFIFLSLITVLISTASVSAQSDLLGKINFPNSGSEAAQNDFMEGVLYLHNFEYGDAIRSFEKARNLDPDFAMAYYGEAKAYNHPIWQEQDRDAALSVLNAFGSSVAERQSKIPSQREKDLMMSLEVLYGNTPETRDLTKQERDDVYQEYMAGLHAKYPNDHEITAFYGLSILGAAHEGRDFAIYMKAAAELFPVWEENKEHPGAAHYLIHSFDDPVHAPLGLPMARAYSEIAPKAAHAQHMTSHIFLARGMWEDVISANIVARDVQTGRQSELGEPTTVCGHYTWWLMYGYLQTGDQDDARDVFKVCTERVHGPNARTGNAAYGERWHYAQMRAHYIVDAEAWDLADEWTLDQEADQSAGRNYFFTNAYAAIHQGDLAEAEVALAKLKQAPVSPERDIQVDQILGLIAIEEGATEEGIRILQRAAEAEAALPIDFGPPVIVKPSFELLGDVYSSQAMADEAREAYELQLKRTPERYLSLQGLADLGN